MQTSDSIYKSLHPVSNLSTYLSTCLSTCLSAYLSIYLPIYMYTIHISVYYLFLSCITGMMQPNRSFRIAQHILPGRCHHCSGGVVRSVLTGSKAQRQPASCSRRQSNLQRLATARKWQWSVCSFFCGSVPISVKVPVGIFQRHTVSLKKRCSSSCG